MSVLKSIVGNNHRSLALLRILRRMNTSSPTIAKRSVPITRFLIGCLMILRLKDAVFAHLTLFLTDESSQIH